MNDKPHCMIDFETFGNRPDTAVISLGMTLFDKNGIYFSDEWFFDKVEQDARSISESTLKWWESQPNDAFVKIKETQAKLSRPITAVLADIQKAVPGKFYIWGNGASFDVPILEDLFFKANMKIPWAFWDIRCYRTLKNLFPNIEKGLVNEAKHNALADAKFQAEGVINYLKGIK